MSDRSALQFQIHQHDPAKADTIRAFIDEYGPCMGDGIDEVALIEETPVGTIQSDDIPRALIAIDPTIAYTVWQDPKYQYLGDIAMHHPDLGTFVGPCDGEGSVVLAYVNVQKVTTQEALRAAFGQPWVEKLAEIDKRNREAAAAAETAV